MESDEPVPERVREALSTVHDPCCREKGISVVDMGLLRSIELIDGHARVELMLTSGWCPFAASIVGDVEKAVTDLPGVDSCTAEIVWDEAWTTDRLSPSASAKLRLLPDPVAVGDRNTFLEGIR